MLIGIRRVDTDRHDPLVLVPYRENEIESMQDFETMRHLDLSNASRTITIVNDEASAQVLATIAREDGDRHVCITRVDDDIYGVAVVHRDYDSGEPIILDLRTVGEDIEHPVFRIERPEQDNVILFDYTDDASPYL